MVDPLIYILIAPALLATAMLFASPWMGKGGKMPPGTVVHYSPAVSGKYIGSPGIVRLENGDYVAKCDLFGPKSGENLRATTLVFVSSDGGNTWQQRAEVQGMYWATLFGHRGALYLIGTDHAYGNVVIARSSDQGRTWSEPMDDKSGILRSDARYHCAPVPVVEHGGRLWRAMEDAMGPGGWGHHFRARMFSAPIDADLLNQKSWTVSNPIERDATWNKGDFGGWLEGNAVVLPDGSIGDLLRVDTQGPEDTAALVNVSKDGKTATFDPATGFFPMPGGAKKFTIRWDAKSRLYWSIVNYVPTRHRAKTPGSIRNTLALVASPDLRNWEVRSVLLYHPDTTHHGFQYVDWIFEGDDLVFVSRTAYDDESGGAHNYHDANYLTFHRVPGFRAR